MKRSGKPVERFLQFISISGHDNATLTDVILETLKANTIPIGDCAGQSYNNANNAAGKYSGVQTRIKEENPAAEFAPCSAHSLTLVGSYAAECCFIFWISSGIVHLFFIYT